MREILFRGKTEKGEWVEGSLHIIKGTTEIEGKTIKLNEHYILTAELPYYMGWELSDTFIDKKVIPETVGQFADFEDAEGRKAFEGDMDYNGDVVHWCDRSLSYQLATYNVPTREFIHCNCYECTGNYNLSECHPFVIIGNIHDNEKA